MEDINHKTHGISITLISTLPRKVLTVTIQIVDLYRKVVTMKRDLDRAEVDAYVVQALGRPMSCPCQLMLQPD